MNNHTDHDYEQPALSPVSIAMLEEERAKSKRENLLREAQEVIEYWFKTMEIETTSNERCGFLARGLIKGNYDMMYELWQYEISVIAEAVRQLYEQGWEITPRWNHWNFVVFKYRQLQGITFQPRAQINDIVSVENDLQQWITKLPGWLGC